MKKIAAGFCAALGLLAATGAAEAQSASLPLSFEIRAGLAQPTGDFGDALNTGYTIGANAMFNITPMLGVYAGYTFNSFGIDDEDGLFDEDLNFNLRGFDAGVRASFATSGTLQPFVKGGLVYYKGELSGDGASVAGDSELGFEVGGGLDYALGNKISVTPALSYTQVSGDDGSDAKMVKLDIGLRFKL